MARHRWGNAHHSAVIGGFPSPGSISTGAIAPGPLLLYYASHAGRGKVQIVGTPFRDQFYSIVMPKDSPYRKPINRAILTLKENGTYRQIYQKWFGVEPQD